MDHTRRIARSVVASRSPGRDGGFTLAEVLVSLGLFALIAVGSLGILGSVEAGGPLAATPTAVGAVRLAKDLTAAAVYLQSVQEFLTSKTAAQLPTGEFCQGQGCPVSLPPSLADIPLPPSAPGQLSRPSLLVIIERWHWDTTSAEGRYCLVGSSGCGASSASESLMRAAVTLNWEFRSIPRSMTFARFIP